ncbi:DUF2269 domain-containing protein [Streptomyces sp. NBC_01089]|uniref:DUF2269 domain-containing protein n=1 Tax=Streptomyces sp. NBC_01089 TaxID=2903747 RepID=UPI003865D53D|nr:DUF2269 domain-containing protein [Streptomyces sp. NBC_01089]
MKPLSRSVRRAVLVVHVAVSVGWLGLTVGLLALGITAYTCADASVTEAAYRSMKVFGDWLVIPIGLLTLISGVVLSLGTHWGLARHRWVWVKFWLTLVTLAASALALRPQINGAAASGHHPDLSLVSAPTVASSAYFFMTAISVLKPWGLTARGREYRDQRRTARKAVDGAHTHQRA